MFMTQAHSVSLLFTTLELNSKGVSASMGFNGPLRKLKYFFGMGYEDWIGYRFTFVHKGILVITQCCIGVCEQGLWIGLID